MVLYMKNKHTFQHDFETVTLAYFNRYPNPYSKHVKSIDTVEKYIDLEGKLHQTKLIRKCGHLPNWVRPFLGTISSSWIVEKTVVDPICRTMQTYNCNLDYTKLLTVEESTFYKYDFEKGVTHSTATVSFRSRFKRFGALNLKDKIEDWSKTRFTEHSQGSRMGLKIVMERVRQKMADRLKQSQEQLKQVQQVRQCNA